MAVPFEKALRGPSCKVPKPPWTAHFGKDPCSWLEELLINSVPDRVGATSLFMLAPTLDQLARPPPDAHVVPACIYLHLQPQSITMLLLPQCCTTDGSGPNPESTLFSEKPQPYPVPGPSVLFLAFRKLHEQCHPGFWNP